MVIHNPAGLEGGEQVGRGEDVVVAGGGVDGPPGKAVVVGVEVAETVDVAGFEEAGDGEAGDIT